MMLKTDKVEGKSPGRAIFGDLGPHVLCCEFPEDCEVSGYMKVGWLVGWKQKSIRALKKLKLSLVHYFRVMPPLKHLEWKGSFHCPP